MLFIYVLQIFPWFANGLVKVLIAEEAGVNSQPSPDKNDLKPSLINVAKFRIWGVKIPFVDIHLHPKMGHFMLIAMGHKFQCFYSSMN